MPEKLGFTIKPLTPIFTGGTEGKCDHLYETGLMGSFRWWFEVLVRGIGGSACDPSTHECKDGNYCDACFIFGTTGLRRAFSLKVERSENKNYNERLPVIKVVNKRTHYGWYLQPGITCNLTGIIYYPLRPWLYGLTNDNFEQILLLTFNLASLWGGLGAGTSKGFGVCEFNSAAKLNIDVALEGLAKLINKEDRLAVNGHFPVLNEFFFTKIQFDPGKPEGFLTDTNFNRIFSPKNPRHLSYYTSKNIIPISPLLRYHLRQLIRNAFPNNHALRHRLMGKVEGQNRQKSLINVSHAYAVPANENIYEFRIWGWIPQNPYKGVQRKTVMGLLRQWTASDGGLWKRCNLIPDSSYDQWFDMLEGNIGQNIKKVINCEGRGSR